MSVIANILRKVQERTPQLIVARKDLYPHIEVVEEKTGEKILQDAGKVAVVPKLLQNVIYNPANTIPSTFFTSSGNTVDIKIENYAGVLKNMFLEIRVSESGGVNSVTPTILPLWIQRIEFYSEAGSSLIQTIYGDNLLYNLGSVLTQEQMAYVAQVTNMNSSFGNPQAISASGTARYYLPILGSFVDQFGGIFMQGLDSYLLMRIFSQNAVESGSGTLNLTQLSLHCMFEQIPEHDSAELLDVYRNHVSEKPFLDYMQFPITQTFNLSTQYTFTLSSFVGICPYLIGGLRSSTSNISGGARTYASIGSTAQIEMADSNGTNVIGGSSIDFGQMRYMLFPQDWPGTIAASYPLIYVPFTDSASEALTQGQKLGFFYFDGRDQFKITLDSAFSSGTYTLNLYGPIWRHCHIQRGRLQVFKS